LPVSFGVWESVFDGLQRLQLRNRRRKRRLVRTISELRNAASQLPDAVVGLNDANRIEWFNQAAARYLGLSQQDDMGAEITEILPDPMLEDELSGGSSGKAIEIPSPANSAWVLSLQVTRSQGKPGRRLIVAQNITPFYRLEEARRNFVADVSHELRTPLTVFRGYLETLQDLAMPDSTWARPISEMSKQSARMQNLVDDLLAVSRLEMAQDKPPADVVSVAELLADICAEAESMAQKTNHEISLNANPNIGLRGDRRELRSAFSNLIFNALNHTPAGTHIRVNWDGDATQASMSVEDDGMGIAPRHLPRLTDRFYRVDASRSRGSGGTGLGLTIVKQVLERYGAELRIESKAGRGSRFSCRFPAPAIDMAPEPLRQIADIRTGYEEPREDGSARP
jgi:two-component system phosphate regulon sensor histidine kinase PhoR